MVPENILDEEFPEIWNNVQLFRQLKNLEAGTIISDYIGDRFLVVEIDRKELRIRVKDLQTRGDIFWVPRSELRKGFTTYK